MDDALGVGGGERFRDLGPDGDGVVERQRPAAEHAREALAFDVLHDDVGMGVDVEDVVDRRDVGVGEPAGGARLAMETLARVGHAQPRFRRTLERDVPPEPRVFSQIDLAHAAAAEALQHGVRSNPLTNQEGASGCVRGAYSVRGMAVIRGPVQRHDDREGGSTAETGG